MWGEQVQQHMKLCVKRNLTEHDIVSRIMRKDNYLIGAPSCPSLPGQPIARIRTHLVPGTPTYPGHRRMNSEQTRLSCHVRPSGGKAGVTMGHARVTRAFGEI